MNPGCCKIMRQLLRGISNGPSRYCEDPDFLEEDSHNWEHRVLSLSSPEGNRFLDVERFGSTDRVVGVRFWSTTINTQLFTQALAYFHSQRRSLIRIVADTGEETGLLA